MFMEMLRSSEAPLVAGRKENRKSRARSGRPVIDLNSQMLQHADAIVREDQRITTRWLVLIL